jgi:CheY-like chemotaxis protein
MKIRDSGAQLTPAHHAGHGKDRSAPRILVIEDQSHVRACIMLSHKARRLEAVAVGSGVAALKEFEASRFDLAIVDIFMLGMDGIAVIKALRSRRPGLPVIAISGVHLDSLGGTALDSPEVAGMSGIIRLPKPFQTDQPLGAIRTAMDNA